MAHSHVFEAPPREAPTVYCVGSQYSDVEPHILVAAWQPAIVPGGDGCFWLSCEQSGCPMHRQSLTDTNYPPTNLSTYIDDWKARGEK